MILIFGMILGMICLDIIGDDLEVIFCVILGMLLE